PGFAGTPPTSREETRPLPRLRRVLPHFAGGDAAWRGFAGDSPTAQADEPPSDDRPGRHAPPPALPGYSPDVAGRGQRRAALAPPAWGNDVAGESRRLARLGRVLPRFRGRLPRGETPPPPASPGTPPTSRGRDAQATESSRPSSLGSRPRRNRGEAAPGCAA